MAGKAKLVPTVLIAVLCLVLAPCATPAMAVLSLEVAGHQTIIPVNQSVTLIGSGRFPVGFVLGDQVGGTGGGRVTWTVDGRVIAEQQSAQSQTTDVYTTRIELFRDRHFVAYLTIEGMDASKNGEYCFKLKAGESVHTTSQTLELAVEYRPSNEYPKCSVLPVDDDMRLECKSERGSPLVSLQWMKDGDSLQQTVDDDEESFLEVYTTVAGPEAINMGRYECSMTYKGSSAGSCFLDRPTVWIPTSTSGLAIGEDLEVICLQSASDNPPVSAFKWEVKPDRHHTVGSDGAVLHISNITSHDNGTEIICEGQNAMGRSIAGSVIILRPVEATQTPITLELEQSKIPEHVGALASFECRTTPEREMGWLFNGQYIDPQNHEDRFFVEGNLNQALSVRGVTREDVPALVTCFVAKSFQKKFVMNLKVDFSLTLPTETPNHKLSTQTDVAKYGSHAPAVSQTPNLKPILVTPKLDTSTSKDESSFFNSQIMWYIVGGMMCVVLLGICCWVSLKAKSLMCDPQGVTKTVVSPTSPTPYCRRINDDDFVVRVGMPSEVRPSLTPDQSLLTKEQLVEHEVQYQDLEDVTRQRQTNEYQRIINNDWIPPTHI
ncbi:uncharacterized protein LOC117293099 [Asterias rubens]|uniref:uncharacterized protein LOC117293099 n=1 Tax=Asterias rubens TaxID=7604 RepID=UPI00145542DE|nr:uncharacterized protein LOC117293099 [Asterias rubens]